MFHLRNFLLDSTSSFALGKRSSAKLQSISISSCCVLFVVQSDYCHRRNFCALKNFVLWHSRTFVCYKCSCCEGGVTYTRMQPGAVKLVLWHHWMHLNFMHPVASENQFHCTRLYVHGFRVLGIFVLSANCTKNNHVRKFPDENFCELSCGCAFQSRN